MICLLCKFLIKIKNGIPTMKEEIREMWLKRLRGDAQERNSFYEVFEQVPMLKYEHGVTIYKNILEIANEAGVPLEEVRSRLIPLLDHERPDVQLIAIGDRHLRNVAAKKSKKNSSKAGEPDAEEERQEIEKVPMRTLKDENRNSFLEIFSDGRKGRETMYGYLATKEMQVFLQGPDCMAVYEEIIEIAEEAGVPSAEVSERIRPLLNKELLDAYSKKNNWGLGYEWRAGASIRRKS